MHDPLNAKEFQRPNAEPYPEKNMYGNLPKNTICGVLREIYHRTDDEEVKVLARIATTMAKRITSRLRKYHAERGE